MTNIMICVNCQNVAATVIHVLLALDCRWYGKAKQTNHRKFHSLHGRHGLDLFYFFSSSSFSFISLTASVHVDFAPINNNISFGTLNMIRRKNRNEKSFHLLGWARWDEEIEWEREFHASKSIEINILLSSFSLFSLIDLIDVLVLINECSCIERTNEQEREKRRRASNRISKGKKKRNANITSERERFDQAEGLTKKMLLILS